MSSWSCSRRVTAKNPTTMGPFCLDVPALLRSQHATNHLQPLQSWEKSLANQSGSSSTCPHQKQHLYKG